MLRVLNTVSPVLLLNISLDRSHWQPNAMTPALVVALLRPGWLSAGHWLDGGHVMGSADPVPCLPGELRA